MNEKELGGPNSKRATFKVDPTMYEERNAFPGRVYRELDQVVRPDLYYHYSTPICAQRWLDVCEDPVYGHKEMVTRLEGAIPAFVEALQANLGRRPRVHLTSLGPGDGALDERLLKGLDYRLEVDSYRGLDFSFDLLRRAAHRLSRAEGFRRPFPIEMVCGDFSDLGACAPERGDSEATNIFSLTGFTIGNYPEAGLLKSIGSMMKEGDYLLVDARLHDSGPLPEGDLEFLMERKEVAGHYDIDTVRRFVFGPVEVATMASADDVSISFDWTRSLTTVPNALNLLIFCSQLETTMRLTGQTVRRDRLDLAVTTAYHFPDLLDWFASVRFAPVWHERYGDAALFLLRRT